MINLHTTHLQPVVSAPRAVASEANSAAPPAADQETSAAATEYARAVPPTAATDPALLEQVRDLRARDREVRQHERAHAAAAAGIAHGAPSFTYTRGSDGQLYAVGGELSIDMSPVAGDPQATLEKARQIQHAALAPAEPSSQDRAVAARAAAMAQAARAELQQASPRGELQSAGGDSEAANRDAGPGDSTGVDDQAASPAATSCAVCGAAHSADIHLQQTYATHSAPSARTHPVTTTYV